MATLTLTLSAGDIKKAVKSDTYITGQIDKSADAVKNASLAYNESAGDDSYHEVKLYRTMKGAVSKFEANMVEYVDPSSGSNVANTLTSATGDNTFTITIPVGSRFYAAFANTLSALAQEYIINIMLYTWWQSIKPALAKDYYQFAQESLTMVTKTLSKTPPETTVQTYTDVTGEIDAPYPLSFDAQGKKNAETKELTSGSQDVSQSVYFEGVSQNNDALLIAIDSDWITKDSESTTPKYNITANSSGLVRTGHVFFSKGDETIILTITQQTA